MRQGNRFQITDWSDPRQVNLWGPSNRIYAIMNESVYFSLWDSWAGIHRITGAQFHACVGVQPFRAMYQAGLYKKPNDNAVYIWDDFFAAYRWIPDEATFDKYAFSWNKIRERAVISPTTTQWF